MDAVPTAAAAAAWVVAVWAIAEGGVPSSVGALAVIPVFYTALNSPRRRDLVMVLGLFIASLVAAGIVNGSATMAHSLAAAAPVLAVCAIIGIATQHVTVTMATRTREATRQAHTDPLTGLPNRRAWDSELSRALASSGHVAVAVLDIDHFKQFNDTYGHPAGDQLLQATAAAWRDQLRAGDVLARLGGEEFGVLLTGPHADMAAQVTERLRECVSHGCTCSAGVALARPGERPDAIVARADTALYAAKATGRDRLHLSQH